MGRSTGFHARPVRSAVSSNALARLGAAALVLGVVSCVSDTTLPSLWPPDDFYLDVRGFEQGAVRERQTQRFQLWADGLAVYRESDRDLEAAPLAVPVFHRVSIYRLDPRSVRTLGRRLERAGLFGLVDDVVRAGGIPMQRVAVHVRAFGGARTVATDLMSSGGLDRTLHVVNAFLPEGVTFRHAALGGSIEPRHVSGVPAPQDDVAGAFAVHRRLAELRPDDLELRLDLLALAIEAGDVEFAQAMLRVIERQAPGQENADFLTPEEWQRDFLGPLRELVRNAGADGGRERGITPGGPVDR